MSVLVGNRCVDDLSVSKINGVERDRKAGGSSLSVRIFELNFIPPTCLWIVVLIFAVVLVTSFGAIVSVSISSVAVCVPSVAVAAAPAVDAVDADVSVDSVVELDVCNEGKSNFKFGRSIFLCL